MMHHLCFLVCFLLATMTTIHSFVHSIASPNSAIRIMASYAPTFEAPKGSWTVEEDTAEVEWGSSKDKLRAVSLQVEEKRLREIEILVAPMDEFRRKHDPVFKAFIARTGYQPIPSIESLPTTSSTASTSSSTTESSTNPVSSLWSEFMALFQPK